MVIRALDHVPHCYTAEDGDVIGELLRTSLRKGERVTLSLDGVTDAPSSFINTAIVALLDDSNAAFIKEHLSIVNSTRQINDLIRRRFKTTEAA